MVSFDEITLDSSTEVKASKMYDSIPENHVYEHNKENQPLNQRQLDKKVCFESVPQVHEYEKMSSEDETPSQSSSSLATNFQLNWKPNLSNKVSAEESNIFKHSSNPKPLPPMPSTLPKSESLKEQLKMYTGSQEPSHDDSDAGFAQNIQIPKLRSKKPSKLANEVNAPNVENDDKPNDDVRAMILNEKLKNLNIGDDSVVRHTSQSSFDFGPTQMPSKLEQRMNQNVSNLENTLDSVLPPDRTPSTIIKENQKMYSKYRNKPRVGSDNSDSYYEDVVLDSVRQNVMNRGIQKIQEEEPSMLSEASVVPAESKNDFSIGDYMHSENSKSAEVRKEDKSRFSSLGSSVPLGESTMDNSAIYSSFVPSKDIEKIKEEDTTMEDLDIQEGAVKEEVKGVSPEVSKMDDLPKKSLEAELKEYEANKDKEMVDDESVEKDSKPEEYSNILEGVSIDNESDAFKPFSEIFLNENSKSSAVEQSNDSASSNFTLKLMQKKKEKEILSATPNRNIQDESLTGSNKRTIDDVSMDVTNTTPRSLAPSRITNSVLNDLISKTNEYATKSGVPFSPAVKAITTTPDSSTNSPTVRTKIFSDSHKFDPPPITSNFEKPGFPRSSTQDSLSSTEEVHNIWASMSKNKDSEDQDEYVQGSTIRNPSMKSSPSMNSVEIKKMLKTKRKISQSNNKRNGLPKNARAMIQAAHNHNDERGSSGEFDDDDDDMMGVDMDTENDEGEYDESDDGDDEAGRIPEHLAKELSKVPKPLLPEQHFGNHDDFEKEVTQELSRFNEDDDTENSTDRRGYVARINNNELIVAKLESKDYERRSSRKGEVFNNKKQHVYKGIIDTPKEVELKSSLTYEQKSSHQKRSRKSEETGNTEFVSARNSLASKGSSVLRKRTSDAAHGEEVMERQIITAKPQRVSVSTKRGHSLKGSIHDINSDTGSIDKRYSAVDTNSVDVNLPKDDLGRLYVRIVGLKNLDLPAISSHNATFSLILDNGIHCISTPEVELDTNTAINQEFELTVSDNLEFILTLKANYSYEGHEKLVEVTEKYPIRKRVLGGLLGHKTIYKTRKRVVTKIDKTDPWDQKMAKDGSFARSYVDFAQYEPLITGKACNFDVTCFNEWETFLDTDGQWKKRQPYRIGKLELQMLYIPRTKINEIFPPSIHVAYEAVKEYQKQMFTIYEGFLSQEGGDCNYLKRRWFTLNGTDLIAHNEFSKKTRAKINLIKAVGLVSSNMKKHYSSGSGQKGARLSEEFVMHQGFKIKFMNGEVIEFVADNQEEKINWLRVLDRVISKNKFRQAWVKILHDHLN